MANILSIGQSALNAAQVGLATTGHNIANASTEGYSRQVVVQGAIAGEMSDFGALGKGTEVQSVQRVYSEFLTSQVLSSQTSQNGLSSYYAQITQINNMFADPTVGVSPAMEDFFKGVQNLAANPASGAARQTMISSAQTLAGQFQDVSGRLDLLRENVNSDIRTSITSINSIATQIAKLNDTISTLQASSNGNTPNDLLDQRDKLVSDLSKEIKVDIVKQGNDYNISIGNGQSLVVGGRTFQLIPVVAPTDPSRMQVGYKSNDKTITLAESSLAGGKLGGALEFRAQTLDKAQNELGRIAIGLASSINEQHRLGQDLNGDLGGDFFKVGLPRTNPSALNTGTAQIAVNINSANALTASDYRFEFIGPAEYRVTRINDGALTSSTTLPISVDGLDFQVTGGSMAAGDVFMVKPTVGGATGFGVLINDTAKIAAAAPVRTIADSANTGSGKMSAGSVTAGFSPASVSPSVTLAFDAATNTLSGFPAAEAVTVTNNGSSTTYAAGTPVPYTEGASMSFAGVTVELSGKPLNGDRFTVGANTNGVGDNRNILMMGALQSAKTLMNGTTSLQGAFGQMVNTVGNKTHELDVNMAAESALLKHSMAAQQSMSGVNLDEEAANLLRYQQAYQAAGKVMQTASKMFDVLLSLGQ